MNQLLLIAMMLVAAPGTKVVGEWFAPEDDCEAVIVRAFDDAKQTIDYQAYNFTSKPIGDAVIRAAWRGVKVRLLLDTRAPGQKNAQASRCWAAGCVIRIDRKHPIHHTKARTVDRNVLYFGSYNDSAQARRNAENLVAIRGPIVDEFLSHFEHHWKHAEPYTK